MNRRLGGDVSLNAPIRRTATGEWQDWLVDDATTRKRGWRTMKKPTSAGKRWAMRYGAQGPRAAHLRGAPAADDPITLEDLWPEFGVSRERVRQIEVRAFEKVQNAVKNRIGAMETRLKWSALQVGVLIPLSAVPDETADEERLQKQRPQRASDAMTAGVVMPRLSAGVPHRHRCRTVTSRPIAESSHRGKLPTRPMVHALDSRGH